MSRNPRAPTRTTRNKRRKILSEIGEFFNLLNDAENWDQLIEDLTTEIGMHPDHANAFARRAILYQLKNEFELAESDFTKAIDLSPEDGSKWSERSAFRWVRGERYQGQRNLHEAEKQFQAALRDLNQALLNDNNNSILLAQRGVIYSSLSTIYKSYNESDKAAFYTTRAFA